MKTHSTIRHIVSLFAKRGAAPSIGAILGVTAALGSVEARIPEVPPEIASVSRQLAEIRGFVSEIQKEETAKGSSSQEVAQWGNWGNWGNWNNWWKPWYNFNNWGNW